MSGEGGEGGGGASSAKLAAMFAAFTVVGAPLVWAIWEGVNALLEGRPGEIRWALVAPALILFAGLLWLVSTVVQRIE